MSIFDFLKFKKCDFTNRSGMGFKNLFSSSQLKIDIPPLSLIGSGSVWNVDCSCANANKINLGYNNNIIDFGGNYMYQDVAALPLDNYYLQQNSAWWQPLRLVYYGNSNSETSGNVEHKCFKNAPAGTKLQTLPNGQKVLTDGNCRLKGCHPDWANMQKYMMQAADELGYTLVYNDVARTVSESNQLYSNATDKRTVAKGGTSAHNYGIAADIRLYKDGKFISPKNDKDNAYGKFAEKVKTLSKNEIEWGGDWKDIGYAERHHFNIRNRKKYEVAENLVV